MLLLQSCQFYNISKNQFMIEDMNYGLDDFLQCGLDKVRFKAWENFQLFSQSVIQRYVTIAKTLASIDLSKEELVIGADF